MKPVESSPARAERIARERAERAARRPAPIRRKKSHVPAIGRKTRDYATWEKSERRKMIGQQCEHRACRVTFGRIEEIRPARHVVRRTYAPDLVCVRENVRFTCWLHPGSPEDYERGEHTTPRRRIVIIRELFGPEAADYCRAEMEKRGLLR